MRHTVSILIVLVLAGSGLRAQTGSPHWLGDLDDALEKAKETGKPILIAMHMKGEIACDRMIRNVYTDPQVLSRLESFVVLPTSPDRHNMTAPEAPCPRFPGINCADHLMTEVQVKEEVLGTDTVKVPQHIILSPDGERLSFHIFEMKKTAFLEFLDQGLALNAKATLGGLGAVVAGYFRDLREGNAKEKKKAVALILGVDDTKAHELLFQTIESMGKTSDTFTCIRAMGYEELEEQAGPLLIRWLRDPTLRLVNAAVVSLEECGHGPALEPLLGLWKSAKDKELRKDIVRALGTVGATDERARAIIMKAAEARSDTMRISGYLATASLLWDKEVIGHIKDRFKKERRSLLPKLAILRAFQINGSAELIPVLREMTSKGSNKQLRDVADALARVLDGDEKDGDTKTLRKSFRGLYVKDKIRRNFLDAWGSGQNNKRRGGRRR